MTVEDTEAGKVNMAKTTVKEGQISYQRTNYLWSSSLPV
jgi:hypothetical protein